MSRVLKLHGKTDAPAVRSLRSAWAADKDVRPEAPPAVDPELAALRRQLEQQAADMADLRRQAEDAFRRGEAQGRAAGLSEAEDHGAKSLARLEGGIERAVTELARALSALERLAPELARQSLAGMLGDDDRTTLVAAIVRRQLKTVEAGAVVHVTVSLADFADEDALAALAQATGVKIHGDGALKSGDCRIKLKLGALDVGLDQQWGRLDALLHDLSQPSGGAHD